MKPTSRPISECPRSRPNPFLDVCNAIALQPNLQSEPRSCGQNRTARLRLHAPPRLASPSRRERGECSAAEGHRRRRLRVRRRPAPPEPTGPRHRGRLAGDRPKKRNCAFTRSNSSRNLDFLNAFASPLQVAKRSNCAFSTVRGQRLSPAVDNDSLEVTTSTRSRTRSSRRDGRCACHARPSTRRRGWTSSATEWRCSTRTAAMAPRCAYVPPHTPATVGGATRSDPPPSLDSEFRKS